MINLTGDYMKTSYSLNVLSECANLTVKFGNKGDKNHKVSIKKQKQIAKLMKFHAMAEGKQLHVKAFTNVYKAL